MTGFPLTAKMDVQARRARFLPLLIALILGLVFAVLLPSYSGPDEKGHVAYVSALAHGHLPIMPSTEFADIERGVTWQAQHPPLFYLIAAPFYKIATAIAPQSGLIIVRLFGVLFFVFTVFAAQKIAEYFVPKNQAWLAALLVATHPVISYVMSMANNESLAILLSTLCVWSALWANPISPPQNINKQIEQRWRLAICALCCGLALLTKLTAVAGVLAAVYLVGLPREIDESSTRIATAPNSQKQSFHWRRALGVFCGAILILLPWLLWMKQIYGSFLPSVSWKPGLVGGPLAILLYPQDALNGALNTYTEFAAGLLSPFWLLHGHAPDWTKNIGSALLLLWMMWTAKKYPATRFAHLGFLALYLIVLNTVFFRFYVTAVFAARYTSAATVLFCVVATQQILRWPTPHRVLVLGAWSAMALANFAFTFWFFLVQR